MVRGYWRYIAAAIGLVSVYLLVVDLSSVSRSLQQEASSRADAYGEDAGADILRRCIGLGFPASQLCSSQAQQSARDNQRIELELAAQRSMAWWTQIMGVAAVLGVGISAIGIWLVWTTFRETRKTNEIAKKQLDWSAKPHLVPSIIGAYVNNDDNLCDGPDTKERLPIYIGVVLENSGKSSAIITRFDLTSTNDVDLLGHGPPNAGRNIYYVLSAGERVNLFEMAPYIHTDQPDMFSPNSLSGVLHIGYIRYPSSERFRLKFEPPPIIGTVEYADALGNEFELGFALAPQSLVPPNKVFERRGGQDRNYDRLKKRHES